MLVPISHVSNNTRPETVTTSIQYVQIKKRVIYYLAIQEKTLDNRVSPLRRATTLPTVTKYLAIQEKSLSKIDIRHHTIGTTLLSHYGETATKPTSP